MSNSHDRHFAVLVGRWSSFRQFHILSEKTCLALNPPRDGDLAVTTGWECYMKSFVLNVSFALFVSAWGISHAQAAPASHPSRLDVSYADLDLRSEAGARVMLVRLQAAAKTVCGGWPDMHDLTEWTIYRNCVRNAMDGAVSQVNAPMVAELYGRGPERLAYSY